MRNCHAYISKAAIAHNLAVVKQYAPTQKIMAMVKANAYGHGLVHAANALLAADAFGVASLEEALQLRCAQVTTPIVLMEGFFHDDELIEVLEHDLILVIHHHNQLQRLLRFARQQMQPFQIWIKVNVGMNRLGFDVSELQAVLTEVATIKTIHVIGLMGHFPQADAPHCDITQQQCELFSQLTLNRLGEHSLANSAGLLSWPQSLHQWVRPGLVLYGAVPFADKTGADYGLQPSMQLTSEIISIRTLAPFAKVGYGGTWQNGDHTRTIAIVAAGYGDGYPWHANSGTPVLVRNQRAYTVGRVSMDMLAIDVTHIPNVSIGDSAVLWGDGLPIEEVARGAQTIPYELLCRLTARVHLHFLD